jgi:hypothetical protein
MSEACLKVEVIDGAARRRRFKTTQKLASSLRPGTAGKPLRVQHVELSRLRNLLKEAESKAPRYMALAPVREVG